MPGTAREWTVSQLADFEMRTQSSADGQCLP
jgi:hypothetical protein